MLSGQLQAHAGASTPRSQSSATTSTAPKARWQTPTLTRSVSEGTQEYSPRSGVGLVSPAVAQWSRWVPILLLVTAISFRASFTPWSFMWMMLLAIFAASKWVTWYRAACEAHGVGVGRLLAYFCAWPGMDAGAFFNPVATVPRPTAFEWSQAISKTSLGAVLLWAIARLVPADWPLLAGWVGMIGMGFLVHFGAFHFLALLWQSARVDAPHIFRAPARAHSVADFWGSRWNLAFRELSHSLVFRPLAGRVGVVAASLAAFVASGFVHELVISLPAGNGYGLPTAYFLIQWLGVLLERSRVGKRLRLRRGLPGWLFALIVVAGPACLLFHRPFVVGVVCPFMRVIGAL
ncbi:MAG: hypothetical protein HY000_09135 [Planctomycetes bacterium]|nr:hypothetical protein [Planctomycetota bacterium]